VVQYAKDDNLSYGCAISEASPAYRKMKQGGEKKKEKKTITINQGKKKLINEYEIELKQNANIYYGNINGYYILGKRMPPMKQGETRKSKYDYNIIKNKLEELTNTKYPDLKDEATIKKRT